MAKILVVDDEPDVEHLVRQTFRRRVRAGELSFSFAANGQEALDALNTEPDIDMILTDINMPVMDGLTLLEQLRGVDSVTKAVVVSAYGDMKNIRTAMNRGAFDFITKPIDREDLQVTVDKTLTHLSLLREALRAHDELVAIRQELDVASRMQQSILPKRFPKTAAYEIFADMHPAKEVGGDFYDFFTISPDRIGFAVADVSGKGIASAFFMAVSHTLLRASAVAGLAPGECLERVNDILCEDNEAAMFVTVFCGVLDLTTGKVVYANGGHNPPYHVNARGGAAELELTGGMALGVMRGVKYAEKTMMLSPGDSLFLYSDGITEAFNRDEVEFGDERLADTLKGCGAFDPRGILERVKESVDDFSGDTDQDDDITCLALHFLEPIAGGDSPAASRSESDKAKDHSKTSTATSNRLSIVLKNDHPEVRRLAELLEQFGEAHDLPIKLVLDLNLALDEVITNTISYGYEDDDEHEIAIEIALQDGIVTVDIVDDAKPFDPLDAPKPDIHAPIETRAIGGLGVHIVKSLMDRVSYRYEDGHNKLRLEKSL